MASAMLPVTGLTPIRLTDTCTFDPSGITSSKNRRLAVSLHRFAAAMNEGPYPIGVPVRSTASFAVSKPKKRFMKSR